MTNSDLQTAPAPDASIEISESAARKIRDLMALPDNAGLSLRIAVNGGGCSGFSYAFTFDDEQRAEDSVFERDGARILVDDVSLNLLAGSVVDYVEQMVGSAFAIRNPQAASSCGCGNSFSVA